MLLAPALKEEHVKRITGIVGHSHEEFEKIIVKHLHSLYLRKNGKVTIPTARQYDHLTSLIALEVESQHAKNPLKALMDVKNDYSRLCQKHGLKPLLEHGQEIRLLRPHHSALVEKYAEKLDTEHVNILRQVRKTPQAYTLAASLFENPAHSNSIAEGEIPEISRKQLDLLAHEPVALAQVATHYASLLNPSNGVPPFFAYVLRRVQSPDFQLKETKIGKAVRTAVRNTIKAFENLKRRRAHRAATKQEAHSIKLAEEQATAFKRNARYGDKPKHLIQLQLLAAAYNRALKELSRERRLRPLQ